MRLVERDIFNVLNLFLVDAVNPKCHDGKKRHEHDQGNDGIDTDPCNLGEICGKFHDE